jgi:hypothetical protein
MNRTKQSYYFFSELNRQHCNYAKVKTIAIKLLKENNIRTFEDLSRLSEHDLLAIQGLGRRTFNWIRTFFVETHHYKFAINNNLYEHFGDVNWFNDKEIIGLIQMCGHNEWDWNKVGTKWVNEYLYSGGQVSDGEHCYKCDGGGTYIDIEGDEYDCDGCSRIKKDSYSLKELQQLLMDQRNLILGRQEY